MSGDSARRKPSALRSCLETDARPIQFHNTEYDERVLESGHGTGAPESDPSIVGKEDVRGS